nr:auxilin-like protein [Tanacetum cinerariifolium]
MVRDILFDICRRAGISAKKEALVNFLTDPSDGRSILRPADVLVFGWVRGKHACVDLTEVSPLVGLSSRGFTAGQTALKAVSVKVTKHEKACIENQHRTTNSNQKTNPTAATQNPTTYTLVVTLVVTRYVGSIEIVECVGPVAYRLKLPLELSCVHDSFHVSNLKKCLAEPDVQVPFDEIEIDENLHFVEEPIEIVERDVKKL